MFAWLSRCRTAIIFKLNPVGRRRVVVSALVAVAGGEPDAGRQGRALNGTHA